MFTLKTHSTGTYTILVVTRNTPEEEEEEIDIGYDGKEDICLASKLPLEVWVAIRRFLEAGISEPGFGDHHRATGWLVAFSSGLYLLFTEKPKGSLFVGMSDEEDKLLSCSDRSLDVVEDELDFDSTP